MSIYLAPQSDSPEHIRKQDEAAAKQAWAEALSSMRMLAHAFLCCAVVLGVVLVLAWGYSRQDDVDAERERGHVEQLQRDGLLLPATDR